MQIAFGTQGHARLPANRHADNPGLQALTTKSSAMEDVPPKAAAAFNSSKNNGFSHSGHNERRLLPQVPTSALALAQRVSVRLYGCHSPAQ